MKASQSPAALSRWETVLLGWLADPNKPYEFESTLTPSSCHFSLREAINGHLRYRHSSIIDPDILNTAWSGSKLTYLHGNRHQLAPRTSFKPIDKSQSSPLTLPGLGSAKKFVVTTDDIDILKACALLANAGVFSSNDVMIEARVGPVGAEFLSSLPNDEFPNVASDQPDESNLTFFLL